MSLNLCNLCGHAHRGALLCNVCGCNLGVLTLTDEVKNFVIGINYKRTLTIDHYCEEVVGVDYRFLKEFKSFYINEKREKKIKSYKMYVRKNPEKSIETGINSILDDFLIKKNAYKNYNINNVEFNLVNLKIAADVLINDLKNNKKILYLKKNN